MPANSSPREWTLGIIFIVVVAAIWAAASVVTQFIYKNLCFDQPFVLTYVCTSLFALYLPGWGALTALGLVKNPPLRGGPDEGRIGGKADECWDRRYETVALKAGMDDDGESGSSSASPTGATTSHRRNNASPAFSSSSAIRAPLHSDPQLEDDDDIFLQEGGGLSDHHYPPTSAAAG